MTIDTGANLGTKPVTAVGTTGAAGTGITFTPALAALHPASAPVHALGTGITFTPALASSHASGAGVSSVGGGITFDQPLNLTHAAGATIRGLSTGIAFTPALALPRASGATVARLAVLVISPALMVAHAAGATVATQPVDYCRPTGSSQNSGSCKPIRPTFLLRKAFTVDPVSAHGAVVSARLYASGLGWSILTVNDAETMKMGS